MVTLFRTMALASLAVAGISCVARFGNGAAVFGLFAGICTYGAEVVNNVKGR